MASTRNTCNAASAEEIAALNTTRVAFQKVNAFCLAPELRACLSKAFVRDTVNCTAGIYVNCHDRALGRLEPGDFIAKLSVSTTIAQGRLAGAQKASQAIASNPLYPARGFSPVPTLTSEILSYTLEDFILFRSFGDYIDGVAKWIVDDVGGDQRMLDGAEDNLFCDIVLSRLDSRFGVDVEALWAVCEILPVTEPTQQMKALWHKLGQGTQPMKAHWRRLLQDALYLKNHWNELLQGDAFRDKITQELLKTERAPRMELDAWR